MTATYTQNLAAAAESVERNAKQAGLQDYYRARSYREMAEHYARLADEKAAELAAALRTAGTVEQAMAVLDLASGDQLSDVGVAYLCDTLLKFLADRTEPCAFAAMGPVTHRSLRALINHLDEARTTTPVIDFTAMTAMSAYREQRRAA